MTYSSDKIKIDLVCPLFCRARALAKKLGYNCCQMLRRVLLAICFAFCLLLSQANGVVWAQDDDREFAEPPEVQSPYGYQIYQDEVDAYREAISDCSSPSLECLVRNTTRFVAIEWVYEIIGPTNELDAEPTSSIDGEGGGAIGGLTNLIMGMYAYPPANTTRYVADIMDNAGMAPPAYAQGLGFASLDPILSLWKTFRNLAYFFFIGVLIFIGIMIMLRQKISAQASVTAQQALPGIIISLILVTFSYAIAGLLIDVMYVSMYLIVGLFNTLSPDGTVGTEVISFNIFQLAGMLFTKAVVSNFTNNTNLIQGVLKGVAPAGNDSGTATVMSYLGGLTLSIILAVAVLIGMIKLFFELLKSYASIIMGVVFAPVYLMMGAIPGKNAFTPWIKNMIGNLAAFPTVLLFVIIFQVFTAGISGDNQGGFMPPFLIGNGQSGIAGYIIGLAILLALPEIVKEVKKKLGAAEGGFGMMVASAAAARGKEAWNKGFMGVNAKSVLTSPLAVAGGVGGYRYGAGKAKKLGLTGQKARVMALGGMLGGAASAPKAPSILMKAPGEIARQYGQAQIKKFSTDVTEAGKKVQNDATALANTQTLEQEKAAAEAAALATAAQRRSGPVAGASNVRGLKS